MFKEKGYDEFLAASIKRGEEDVAAGRVFTLEQTKAHLQKTIEQKARELEAAEREMLIYG
ncbi:hypothetical protein BKK51_06815 [Rodentibacter trehalosifermentans]|uniref:Uncharacterized protein n=1 Tax=Rodentibacter trehalosifermentans TaxID=1908263 RepID=A0A1V3ISM5_9PAST|nr:hypothetical protein [Rodentibacter trehalosifermentans]OOF45257.1 hypothetical protein BKK51_06815 [Rodentibacter trehalosifermentans]